MVHVHIGDLFESKAQTLVNTVNCVGVMGKGIALEFKERFPAMFEDYQARCTKHEVRLGEPYLYRELVPPWVLNFPTKDHWRSVSRLGDIIRGLNYLEQHYKDWGIESLAVPPLGCGHGQLEWRVVGPTLYRHLSRFDIPIQLFAPHGTSSAELDPDFLAVAGIEPSTVSAPKAAVPQRIPPAWIALVAVVAKIQHEPFHWPVGRVTFHKIAYFATIDGLPTDLSFRRASFGPFSPDLKPMVAKLVNNGLVVEEPLGQMFSLRPGPTFRDAVRTYRAEIESWAPMLRRVTDLFLRMRTADAEIAATVVHVAREKAGSGEPVAELDVFDGVFEWKKKHRPPLVETEVAAAIRNLNLLGWVHLVPSDSLPVPEEAF